MIILKAKHSDAKELTELTFRSKSHWKYNSQQMEEWREELTISEDYIENNQVFKLLEDDSIFGYYSYYSINETAIKLDNLFIEPTYIKQGFGKILMNDFLDRVTNSKYKKVILNADPNAEEFYKSFGFQVTGKLESSIKDRFMPVMEKEIKSSHNK